MNLIGRTFWQQAAGDTDRMYTDLCLRWGVILNGPGNKGHWSSDYAYIPASEMSSQKKADLKRFAQEMAAGDLVVLRTGTRTVHAVGIVVGLYAWSDAFGDIDGWRLQHLRRVNWLWRGTKEFDSKYTLKQGPTTQKLAIGAVSDWLATLPDPDLTLLSQLPDLPVAERAQDASMNATCEFLYDNGVASASIAMLSSEIDELTRIARWYRRETRLPSEHETVAYLVVPLLRALGWTPQRMAVEWNHVDVALFGRLPREDGNLKVVVEVKKMNASCLSAFSQARQYALSKPNCDRLIVTDGLRYGVFVRNDDGEFDRMRAYLNLTRFQHSYPVYGCKGADEAFLTMAPEWQP